MPGPKALKKPGSRESQDDLDFAEAARGTPPPTAFFDIPAKLSKFARKLRRCNTLRKLCLLTYSISRFGEPKERTPALKIAFSTLLYSQVFCLPWRQSSFFPMPIVCLS